MDIRPAVVLVLATAACSGQDVSLNERIFSGETMTLVSAGCTRFNLDSGETEATGEGPLIGSLVVNQTLRADSVVVTVSEQASIRASRTYDDSFFKSGRLDTFSVAAKSENESLALRYWGSDNGACASLNTNAPASN
jgi:hypothetical protein